MAESLGGSLIQNGSPESRALVQVNWVPGIQNINELPLEILSRILAYLPQKKLVINRGLCRHWRDVIDEHCPMESVTLKDGPFLERKMELRIKKCEIWYLDDVNFWLKNPQSIRTIIFNGEMSDENISRFLNQVRPYLEVLKIDLGNFENNVFRLRHVFPKLREIRISHDIDECAWKDPVTVALDIPYLHQIPSLTKLSVSLSYKKWHQVDETYQNLFNFLGKHGQNMKHLHLDVSMKRQKFERVEPQGQFDLSNSLKTLLYSRRPQFHYLKINLEPRYISSWAPIIQSQKNLVELSLNLGASNEEGGVAVSYIIPGIISSLSTLESICLENIPSVRSGEDSWIPFDCSVFENAGKLRRLKVKGTSCDMRPDIINLGHIPLGSLKELTISHFVCDSGELQTFVDNSQMLESLRLYCTIAPLNSPAFPSTGVHGGIIHSFMDKPNKKSIDIRFCINYSNEAENDKLDELCLLYPNAHERYEYKNLFLWYSDWF